MPEKNAWVGVAKIVLPALLAAGLSYYLFSALQQDSPKGFTTDEDKDDKKSFPADNSKPKLDLASVRELRAPRF